MLTLVREAPAADVLRQMIGLAAKRPMEMKVAGLTGASSGEMNPERLAERMGCRGRI